MRCATFCCESACRVAGAVGASTAGQCSTLTPAPPRALSPDVTFAGYSVPHPHEPRMNLRVQTTGKPSTTALREGLDTLVSLCEHVEVAFDEAVPPVPEE